jgi:hypothetical protein
VHQDASADAFLDHCGFIDMSSEILVNGQIGATFQLSLSNVFTRGCSRAEGLFGGVPGEVVGCRFEGRTPEQIFAGFVLGGFNCFRSGCGVPEGDLVPLSDDDLGACTFMALVATFPVVTPDGIPTSSIMASPLVSESPEQTAEATESSGESLIEVTPGRTGVRPSPYLSRRTIVCFAVFSWMMLKLA